MVTEAVRICGETSEVPPVNESPSFERLGMAAEKAQSSFPGRISPEKASPGKTPGGVDP